MPRSDPKSTVFELYIVRFTDKAVLVKESEEDAKEDAFWLPFSQILDPDEEYIRKSQGEEIELELPNWLAEEKDLM